MFQAQALNISFLVCACSVGALPLSTQEAATPRNKQPQCLFSGAFLPTMTEPPGLDSEMHRYNQGDLMSMEHLDQEST